MAEDIARGAVIGLPLGLGLGYPVSRLFDEDLDGYVAMPGVILAIALIFPVGWLLARLARIPSPLRTALLAPVLLWVLSQAAALAVPLASPRMVLLGIAGLAVVSYAGAARLTGTTSLAPRVIAAGMVCACVVTIPVVEERRAETRQRQQRTAYIDHLRESVPLAVPAVVPGRRLVRALILAEDVLELSYAKGRGNDADVFVRITDDDDPRHACEVWNSNDAEPGCRRLAADRWLWRHETEGRMVLFAKVGHRLVEVDSGSLTVHDALTVGSELRTVSAEYLADVGD
ncbi:hypothetical protein [Nonomuraea sp. NPDC005501]|uniref:hypothetical protein n=1 Tax=Nonomuraea sp. NPDC005501 TaxID=3156884 RepID=UPI0033B4B1E2